MSARHVLVLAMRTWGELGNLLAAKTVANLIATRVADVEITVAAAEDSVDVFREAGERIRSLTLASRTPTERRTRYLALMSELEAQFPVDFEIAREGDARLRTLARALESIEPSLVIATKGVAARAAVAATHLTCAPVPVVNFVTNHGLLLLPIHRTRHVAAHVVQFPEACRRLARFGCAGPPVHMVGPLVAGHNLADALLSSAEGGHASAPSASSPDDVPRIVLFCNRGGEEYAALLRHLAIAHADVDVTVIAHKDPALLDVARALQASRPGLEWRLFDGLAQPQYFREIDRLARSRFPLIVTKSGPNTAVEAAFFGVPMLLIDSGLPMERWVGPWVRRQRLGEVVRGAGAALAAIDRLLQTPERIAAYAREVRAFGAAHLNSANEERFAAVIDDMITCRMSLVRS